MSVRSVRHQLRTQMRESVSVAILEAAEELIASKGLQGAPLAQIAKRAGVAVGTLYNYFADRDALIQALFEMRRAAMRPQMRAALTAGANLAFEPRLRSFVRDLFGVFEEHRKFVKVLLETEHVKLSPSTGSQDMASAIRELVAAGVSEKVMSAKHAELLAIMLGASIKGVALRRIADNSPLGHPDADAVVQLFLDGART